MAAPRKENVKGVILDSTKLLLKNHSFADISLAEIAKASGISKGTLYYHYKTKSEIFFDLTDRYLNEQWNDFIRWTDDKNKDTSIQRLIKYVIERNIADSELRMHLYSEAQMGDEEIRNKLLLRYKEFYNLICKKISERTDVPADLLTWLVLLVSDGIIVQKSLQNPEFSTESFIEESCDYLKMLIDSKK